MDRHAAASGVGRGGAISPAGFGDGGEEAAVAGGRHRNPDLS